MQNRIKIQQIVNSVYSSNTFVISIEGLEDRVWLVDCGDVDRIVDVVGNKKIEAVFFTHTHYDHIYGMNGILGISPDTKLYTNYFGKSALMSPKLNYSRYHQEAEDVICNSPENIVVVNEGAEVSLFGDVLMVVCETPGHDESCITYILEDNVFSGDSYIPGVKVYANFLHSNKKMAEVSKDRIKDIVKNRRLYPGHYIIS